MESSIGEPFVLSSYDSPSKLPKGSENAAGAYASYDQASASSEGYATVAAQGNGVHVLDLSSLHPVASYNLGPTTTFACAPVSQFSVQGSDRHCTTYASVTSSSQSTSSILLWKENLSSPLADRASQKGKSLEIPHTVSHLYKFSELPSRVFVLSKYGDVSVLGSDGEVLSTSPASTQEETVLQNFRFSREGCSFVPPSSHLVIWAQLRLSKQNARLRISAIDGQANFVELHDLEVPLESEKILKTSLSSSGHLSILCHDGSWHLLQIELLNATSLGLTPVVEPIHLASLSFLSAPEEASILSCGTSLVLLAGVTKAREIALLLWDLQYSVLLASQTLPIPTQSNSNALISLDLIESSTSQILLVVSPIVRKSKEKTGSLRSSVFVVPATLPKKSTIANAMGRASAGAQWLVRAESTLDVAQEKLLAEMQAAMQQGRPNTAATAFFEWEKKTKSDDSAEPLELSQIFVKSLLNVVLQPSQSSNLVYSSELVQNLLDRRVVSASVVEAGLLRVLRLRNDWKSIEKALSTVLDFSEMEIIETLAVVVANYKRSTSSDDAMQVDVDIPALPHFLALCVKSPTSSAALRLAIRRYLTDGEDLLCVLQVVDSWFTSWASKEVKLLPSKKSLVKNEFGVLAVEPETYDKVDSESDALPSLRNIVNFLQSILDASFVSLIQYAPSHRLLRKLQGHIEPQAFTLEQNERLRGSLLPFVKLQARALRDAKNGIANDGKPAQQEDWRQRKKQIHEQAGMAIGVYQVEELVL